MSCAILLTSTESNHKTTNDTNIYVTVSESITVSAGSPDPVERGQTATLPCWLNPPLSAEDLEVRWYHGSHFDTPVMLYKAKKFDHQSQEASYNGRVSFGLKDASSGGLKTGDVSLKLVNVTVEDAGDYICYISSEGSYDSTTASLRVRVTGNPPLLSAVWTEDNVVNVSCKSEGWYPQPVLRWSDRTKDLNHGSQIFTMSSGLYSVHSWLTVPTSSEVSCSVGLYDEAMQKARFYLDHPPPAGQREKQSLLSEGEEVNVKLEDTENEFMTIKGTKVRDAVNKSFPDGDKVTCLTAIKGKSGISSGRHYWEVSLGNANIETKKSWWIGVTSAAEIPQELDFSPNTINGFWFLSSSPDIENALLFSTEPKNVFPFFNPGKGDNAVMEILQRPEQNNDAVTETPSETPDVRE
ncbi:butyrophilin subfamily 2 member A2-like [Xenentodon cancila]